MAFLATCVYGLAKAPWSWSRDGPAATMLTTSGVCAPCWDPSSSPSLPTAPLSSGDPSLTVLLEFASEPVLLACSHASGMGVLISITDLRTPPCEVRMYWTIFVPFELRPMKEALASVPALLPPGANAGAGGGAGEGLASMPASSDDALLDSVLPRMTSSLSTWPWSWSSACTVLLLKVSLATSYLGRDIMPGPPTAGLLKPGCRLILAASLSRGAAGAGGVAAALLGGGAGGATRAVVGRGSGLPSMTRMSQVGLAGYTTRRSTECIPAVGTMQHA